MSLDNNTECNECIKNDGNLIRNSGFEYGDRHWVHNNVSFMYSNSFEGKGVAVLEGGNSNLYQIVPVTSNKDFMLSFAVQSSLSFDPGDLTIKVMWLDYDRNFISMGLNFVVPSKTIGRQLYWLTYIKGIENPPLGSRYAMVMFIKSKDTSTTNDVIQLDNVIFVAI